MRWHLIRDQVRQGVFDTYWREGASNLADFCPKAAHESHHAIMPYIITSPP